MSRNDPLGLEKVNRTTGQITGVEKNPPAIDAIDGYRENATSNSRQSGQLFAPLPNEGSLPTIKAQRLREFDEMKRKALRARQ